MTQPNLILYAATYPDAQAASDDYQSLKAASGDDLPLLGAVVMHRGADGAVQVDEKTPVAAGGAALGGAVGLVVGLFAPPLLLATAVGAGLGALGGELTKRHDEKKLGMALDDVMPADTSAIVAIVDDQYADRVDKALTKATKKVTRAIDSGDYDKLAKALSEGDQSIAEALES
jgi:uncharacterized membrane protein